MDSDFKQAIIEKLRLNGTLDRIQAELRCAVFLAIESNDDSELKVDGSKLDQRLGYSIIYHFLKQNRFLATAAVFEKEIHQQIISLEELKKENVATFCFQFFGDTINLSNFTSTEIKRTMNDLHSTRIGINEMSNIDSNFVSSLGENNSKKNDVETIEKQQIVNFELNRTLKSLTSDNEISNDENEASNRNEGKSGTEIQDDRSIEKTINNDKVEKYNNENINSSSKSSTIFEHQQLQQTAKRLSSSSTNKCQQQSTKYITSLSSTHPRKLPPIIPVSNESAPTTKLPSISSLNKPSNQTGTGTVAFSSLLDTILKSPSSNKSETDEDIVEELIADDLLQSDNNSDATISF
ncbi:unnamed protein product [Acanthocheilonema viteae]|uniref:LisH domain-containing protein n=1 Tax=Acanthocheilonema viteae TaxID=6277 RepID=A0A498SDZ6_ACAVI|nr:unnamed protein product [Acanthocheilonema viteae]